MDGSHSAHSNFFFRLSLIALLGLAIFSSASGGSTPGTAALQGRLTSSTGEPQNLTGATVVVRLYTASSGGTLVMTDTHSSVTVNNGHFNVSIGGGTITGTYASLQAAVDAYSDLWYSIEVDSDGESSPRTKLQAVPYSLQADKLDGIDSSGFGQLASANTWTQDNSFPSVIVSSKLKFGSTSSNPSIRLSGTGLIVRAVDDSYPGNLFFIAGGGLYPGHVALNRPVWHYTTGTAGIYLNPNNKIAWSSTNNAGHGTNDIGIYRDSAGVLRITDGSSGVGQLYSGTLRVESQDDSDTIALVKNTSTDSEACGMTIELGVSDSDSDNHFMVFRDAGGVVGVIEGDDGDTVSYTSGTGADFAEYFEKLDPTEEMNSGDIVFLTDGGKITKDFSKPWHKALVVSKSPAFIGNAPFERVGETDHAQIAQEVRAEIEPQFQSLHTLIEPDKGFSVDEEIARINDECERAILAEAEKRIRQLERTRTKNKRAEFVLCALVGQVEVSIRGTANAGDFIMPDGTAVPKNQMDFQKFMNSVGQAMETGGGQIKCLIGVK